MQSDPVEDWRRLTGLYSEMSGVELRELAADFAGLTDVARQVLRDEMKKRGLPEPRAEGEAPKNSDCSLSSRWNRPDNRHPGGKQSDDADVFDENNPPQEFTWKTPLCDCDDLAQAWQISEVLRRAGIERWVETTKGLSGPRIMVAADQLDEAREIAAGPIPQEIIDESKMDVPEFVLPKCPKCGAEDPVLEGADPVNTWRCETCGKLWSEPPAALKDKQKMAGP